jgi:hypothetical protein
MLDAVVSRVATGLAAKTAASEKIADLQAALASAFEKEAAPEDLAVVKTISSEGQDYMRAAFDQRVAENGHAEMVGRSGEDRGRLTEDFFDTLKHQMDVGLELRHIKRGQESLAENQRIYAKMEAAGPVPAKELTGDQKDDVFKLMRKLGIPRSVPGHDSVILVNEGTRYIAHKDGKLEAHDAEIAPTREDMRRWLDFYAREINYGKTDPAPLQAELEALTARVDAMKALLFKGR